MWSRRRPRLASRTTTPISDEDAHCAGGRGRIASTAPARVPDRACTMPLILPEKCTRTRARRSVIPAEQCVKRLSQRDVGPGRNARIHARWLFRSSAATCVILGLGPRTQRSASSVGGRSFLCQHRGREVNRGPTRLFPASAYAAPWVLGTSPRMTSGVAATAHLKQTKGALV
jgi:hypothetical protein